MPTLFLISKEPKLIISLAAGMRLNIFIVELPPKQSNIIEGYYVRITSISSFSFSVLTTKFAPYPIRTSLWLSFLTVNIVLMWNFLNNRAHILLSAESPPVKTHVFLPESFKIYKKLAAVKGFTDPIES